MYVKALILNDTEDDTLRVLIAVLPERRTWVEISPSKGAKELNMSEGSVRYQIKKLEKLGYIRPEGRGYMPTDQLLFLNIS